jgi:alpha-L-fucosidase
LFLTGTALGAGALLAPVHVGRALAADTRPDYEPTRESLDTHPVPRWYKDAKFGIFIHWGAYAVPAGTSRHQAAEWYVFYQQWRDTQPWEYHRNTYGEQFVYDQFIPQWKAERYDPDSWVRLFEQAGAEYFVLTSKHHDGFSLFPSAVTDRHSVAMGPRRDLVGDLFAAARRRGTVRPGLYYSLGEWFNPSMGRPMRNFYTGEEIPLAGYKPVTDYVRDYEHRQLREIIDRYDPDLLWADGQWTGLRPPTGPWLSEEPIAHYYNQAKNRRQPKGVLINDRFETHADFLTYEQSTASGMVPRKWEHCVTIGYSWGYNKHELPEDFKTSEFLVHRLVDVVSKNGNLLLNIGPRADGTIPEILQERLRDIGDWLAVNGAAIYASAPWIRSGDPGVRYTVTPGKFNVIVLDWPGTQLRLPGDLPIAADARIRLRGQPLSWTRRDGAFVITMPDTPPGKYAHTLTVDWHR